MQQTLIVGFLTFIGWTLPAFATAAEPGAVMIIGGGPTPTEIYEAFFALAGGTESHLIHIPTATDRFEAITDKQDYYSEWTQRPAKSFQFLHTRSRYEAETATFAEPLARASGVWIGGGDQNNLSRIYGHTPVLAGLYDVVRRGGVVAGTSSGASIMSEIMISDETEHGLSVGYGFAMCRDTLVDCHFTERGRLPRMLRFVQSYPRYAGIGVDEKTALILQGERATVIGQGRAWFFYTASDGKLQSMSLASGNAEQLVRLCARSALTPGRDQESVVRLAIED
jgi:cyanophycinase